MSSLQRLLGQLQREGGNITEQGWAGSLPFPFQPPLSPLLFSSNNWEGPGGPRVRPGPRGQGKAGRKTARGAPGELGIIFFSLKAALGRR